MSRSTDRDIQNVVTISVRLSAVQEEIRVKMEEEAKLKAQLRSIIKPEGQPDAAPAEAMEPKNGTTLAVAIPAVLDAEPEITFTSEMVRAKVCALNFASDIMTIRSSLARLAQKKRIDNVGRGLYQSVHRAGKPKPGMNGSTHPEPAVGGEEVGPTH